MRGEDGSFDSLEDRGRRVYETTVFFHHGGGGVNRRGRSTSYKQGGKEDLWREREREKFVVATAARRLLLATDVDCTPRGMRSHQPAVKAGAGDSSRRKQRQTKLRGEWQRYWNTGTHERLARCHLDT